MSTEAKAKADEHGIPVIAQIIGAFATLAGIIIILSVSIFLAFERIEPSMKTLASNTVPILDDIGAVQENLSAIQISVLRSMLAETAEEKTQAEQLIAAAYAANTVLLQKKKGLVLTAQEEEMYASVLESRKAYAELWQRQLELSRAGKRDEALRFNRERLRPAYDAYQNVLNKIAAHIKKQTKNRVASVVEFMGAVQRICDILSVAGLCIAIGMGMVIVRITKKLRANNRRLAAEVSQRKNAEQHLERLIFELKDALDNIKQLSGLLPICASCKKIRDDHGYWQRIETYISQHSEAQFTHGLCPECSHKLYSNGRDNDNPEKS